MRLAVVCCLLFVVNGFSIAQNKYETREEKLLKLKSRSDIKVTEIEKDILKIEYPNGKVTYKNISNYHAPVTDNLTYSPTYDSTIIDLTTIDTTLYYQKYSFWQEVPLSNLDFDYLRIADVNNNENPELYGSRKFFSTPIDEVEPITVYELNVTAIFIPVYQYDSVYTARNIFDIDNDENEEVLLTLPSIFGDDLPTQQRFFSKTTDTSLATELNIVFAPFAFHESQLNDITIGDFDNEGYTDILFIKALQSQVQVYIFEYNLVTNNFDSVYSFVVDDPIDLGAGGFSVSDFDLDGKSDIVFSTVRGKVFVIESEGNNQYINTWKGSVESYNAYIHTWTNDIDGNGKPEFLVLADGTFNGISKTRITIFEANGNNNYEAVGRIDLIGVFSFYAGTMQAVDIDNDGVEEVAICIDGNFLILKFTGSENHHTYEVYYIKQNELNNEEEYQVYFGATMYDLRNMGEYEILISMYHTREMQPNLYRTRSVTKIYKPDSTTSINDEEILPTRIKLHQNYPNPFNPLTNIRFELKKIEIVSIKIYDILGKEIKLLLNKELPAGEYTIQWDGKDDKGNNLSGGVYFIQMTAGNYRQTIKSVLLK